MKKNIKLSFVLFSLLILFVGSVYALNWNWFSGKATTTTQAAVCRADSLPNDATGFILNAGQTVKVSSGSDSNNSGITYKIRLMGTTSTGSNKADIKVTGSNGEQREVVGQDTALLFSGVGTPINVRVEYILDSAGTVNDKATIYLYPNCAHGYYGAVLNAGQNVALRARGVNAGTYTVTLSGTTSTGSNKADIKVADFPSSLREVVSQNSDKTFGKQVKIKVRDIVDNVGTINDQATIFTTA